MELFNGLLDLLKQVPDPRRAEGQLYKLPYVLLFSILAVVTGANSPTRLSRNQKGVACLPGICGRRGEDGRQSVGALR